MNFHRKQLARLLAGYFALGVASFAVAQMPDAPQMPGARPMPGPTATPTPRRSPIEERNVPPEVENPPASTQRMAQPRGEPLPMPGDIEERQASPDMVGHPQKPCPQTMVLQAPPPNTTTPYAPDFPSSPGLQWIEPNFNGTMPNRHVRHTFSWDGCKKRICCEVYRAKLEVTVKALQDGQSHTSPDAGNDSISIWKNGSLLHWQYIWPSNGVAAGTVQTITIPVQASWLNSCRLSFQVQDDTAVLNAKLVATGCCVKPNVNPNL
jgi:hypothetical protein